MTADSGKEMGKDIGIEPTLKSGKFCAGTTVTLSIHFSRNYEIPKVFVMVAGE
jgi:hypothetical protein